MIQRTTLHEQVATVLRKEVREAMKPGDRLPSESKLAKRFQVSIVTLREAVLKLSQEGLLERRQGSGTYVCEPTRPKHIAVLFNAFTHQIRASFFFLQLLADLRDRLDRDKISAQIHVLQLEDQIHDNLSELNLAADVEAGRIDGVVTISVPLPPLWAGLLADHGVPVIGGETYCVHSDYEQMIREAVQIAFQDGRRRPCLVQTGGYSKKEAQEGLFLPYFIDELEKQGETFSPEQVCPAMSIATPGSGWHVFREYWQSKPNTDALIVCDDHIYREVSTAIVALGISVPDDLLVITQANKGSDIFYPFPTIRMEFTPAHYADQLAGLVKELISGETPTVPKPHVQHTVVGHDTKVATV